MNVYESGAAAVAPAASVADCTGLPMSAAPAPVASVARWKRLAKPAPVEPPPWLVIVEVKVAAVPAVAVVGETAPAIRSGDVLVVTLISFVQVAVVPPVPVTVPV